MNNEGKASIVMLVTTLVIIILGLLGYIAYDKALRNHKIVKVEDKKDNETKKDSEDKSSKISRKGYEIIGDIDEEIIEILHSELIATDNSMGLYFKDKVEYTNANNEDLIILNLKQYVLDNNIDLSGITCGVGENENDFYKVNKNTIKEYMNKKYDNDIEYKIIDNSNEYEFYSDTKEVRVTDENYGITCIARGSEPHYFGTKIVKVEKQDDYLYIYDKAASCFKFGDDSVSCGRAMTTVRDTGIIPIDPLDNFSYSESEGLMDYVFENKSNELYTFKHTFNKHDDGNYYWYSSEIVE